MPTATLPRADYSDTFSVPNPDGHTAEKWARTAFHTDSLRDTKQVVWRGVLQLDLGSLDAPDRVAGWLVVDRSDERLVLAAESWHLTARLVFEASPTAAVVTTRVTYRNPAGRLAWAVVGPIHRRAVPDILEAARRRLEASGGHASG